MRRDIGGVETHQIGRGKIQTDIDQFDSTAVGECVHRFESTERDRERGPYRGAVDRSGRDVDTAGNIHRDHRDPRGVHVREHLRRGRAQRALTGDAHHTINDQIGIGRDSGNDAATCGPECPQGMRVGVLGPQQDRRRGDAPTAKKSRRPQRIPAVVPGPDDGADPPPGDTEGAAAQFGRDRVGQTGGGATHQRTIRQRRKQRCFGRPDLLGGVVVPHQALLDRDGLGEISRLVNIVTAGTSHRRRENLKWHRREQRLEKR